MSLIQANQNVLSFTKEGLGEIRVIDKNGEVWFVAKDVCDVLGLKDVSMSLQKLDEDEKLTQKIFVSGQHRDLWLINESGLYTLILRSNKPNAKKFRKWVTSEVLPTIRKTGTYSLNSNNLPIPESNKVFSLLFLLNKSNKNWFFKLRKYFLIGLTDGEIAKLTKKSKQEIADYREKFKSVGLFFEKDVIAKNNFSEFKFYVDLLKTFPVFYSKKILQFADKIFNFLTEKTSPEKELFSKKEILKISEDFKETSDFDFDFAISVLIEDGKVIPVKKKLKNNRVVYLYKLSSQASETFWDKVKKKLKIEE